jgi:hypothetical protein
MKHNNSEDRISTLLYSTRSVTSTDLVSRTTTVLYRIHLRPPYNSDEAFRISHPHIPNYFPSQLSPDGLWLVYVLAPLSGYETLYVSRADGKDRRQLFTGRKAPAVGLTLPQYAWAPDSTRLIFYQRAPNDSAIYRYDVRDHHPPRRIVASESLDVLGWTDNTHILNITEPSPFRIEQIHTQTRLREDVMEVPAKTAWVDMTALSPNRRHVLMPGKYGECYIADVMQQQAQLFLDCSGRIVWEPGSQNILLIPNWTQPGGEATYHNIDDPKQTTQVRLLPHDAPDGEYQFQAAAPDGRFFLLCHSSSVNSRRTLYLYEIITDTLMTPNIPLECGQVSGWIE